MNPTSEHPNNTLTEWCRLLIGSLCATGLTDYVISPGSRSTPLVAAILQNPMAQYHLVIDERSAAFLALGMVRASARPVALICTSGTAPAHYFPAVIEASESRLPLVILTADRPFELQSCHAPQTIDQVNLFGRFVRESVDLGDPTSSEMALRGMRRRCLQALARAQQADAGPVHVNVRARKPLEPMACASEEDEALRHLVDRLLDVTPSFQSHSVGPAFDSELPASLRTLARRLHSHQRGLIVVGPVRPHMPSIRKSVEILAASLGFPVLMESTSQLRLNLDAGPSSSPWIDGFEHILRSAEARLMLNPTVILHIGGAATSGALDAWLSHDSSVERHVLCEFGYADPFQTAHSIISGPLHSSLEQLIYFVKVEREAFQVRFMTESAQDAEENSIARPQNSWVAKWSALNRAAWRAVHSVLEASSASAHGSMLEAALIKQLFLAIPDNVNLLLGNSLAIREADIYAPARSGIERVYFQRGANGIDGLVSTCAGIALKSLKPLVGILGDVTFLHDTNGLACLRRTPAPLVIVVINNGGGRIFELLPVAKSAAIDAEALALWTTPHHVELAHLCMAYGVPHLKVAHLHDVEPSLKHALEISTETHRGVIIEVLVGGEKTAEFASECRGRVTMELRQQLSRLLAESTP